MHYLLYNELVNIKERTFRKMNNTNENLESNLQLKKSIIKGKSGKQIGSVVTSPIKVFNRYARYLGGWIGPE